MASKPNFIRREMRRLWGQLTSMRTALVLLFLLALAAVPGAALPQRSLNQNKVNEYFAAHPDLAPILDKLWAFDVFASPWFAAIYLLLFVSLIGCLVSRIKVHLRPIFAGPPSVPHNLDRLPAYTTFEVSQQHDAVLASTRKVLRKRGWRRTKFQSGDKALTFSGERGQTREIGNLVFHFSLVAVLIGVATGAFWGWSGGALITEGATFCNSMQSYDQFSPGQLIKANSLPPFCVSVKKFQADFLDNGQPIDYRSQVSYTQGANSDAPSKAHSLSVNNPVRVNGVGVYLINHGYAPILRYTDRYGVVFESPTPFLPNDRQLTSEGVVILPDANQNPDSEQRTENAQVAFEGVYTPTAPDSGMRVRSLSPERNNEGITLAAYRGDTGLNTGIPRSVYALDQKQIDSGKLKQIGAQFLKPGQSWTLDDGTTVEFLGTKQWISVNIAYDPGKPVALAGAVGMLVGLLASLFTRRRRLFIRITNAGDSATGTQQHSVIEVGGLARNDSHAFTAEFAAIVAALRAELSADTSQSTSPGPSSPDAALASAKE